MANNKGLTIALVSTAVLILSSAVGCSALSSIPGSSKKTSEVSINVPSDIVSYVSSIPEISLAEPSIIITSRNESESSVAETVQTITLEEFVELVQEQIDEASISDTLENVINSKYIKPFYISIFNYFSTHNAPFTAVSGALCGSVIRLSILILCLCGGDATGRCWRRAGAAQRWR